MRTRIGVWLAGIVAVGVITASTSADEARASIPTQQNPFEISGVVEGLYPGANATLEARVTNPQPFTIRVVATTTTVDDASPGCPASMLQIGGIREPVDVPSGATGTVPLAVHMDVRAPEACQNATFPLGFVATATDVPGENAARPSVANGVRGLAFTGAQIGALVAIAFVLLALGLLARRAARRRREPVT